MVDVTDAPDLAGWLIEQVAEDERVARASAGTRFGDDGDPVPASGRWSSGSPGVEDDEGRTVAACTWEDYEHTGMTDEDELHILSWDPARVLAVCESRRRIIDCCREVTGDRDLSDYGQFGCFRNHPDAQFGCFRDDPNPMATALAVETLRHLALPYSDRPGYQEAWRP
jgi:hypothetical protein